MFFDLWHVSWAQILRFVKLRQSADKTFGCGGAALGNPRLTPFPQFRIEIFCRT
jgi:hypothetical protein